MGLRERGEEVEGKKRKVTEAGRMPRARESGDFRGLFGRLCFAFGPALVRHDVEHTAVGFVHGLLADFLPNCECCNPHSRR